MTELDHITQPQGTAVNALAQLHRGHRARRFAQIIAGTGLDLGSTDRSGVHEACDRGVKPGYQEGRAGAHRVTEAVELQRAGYLSPPHLLETSLLVIKRTPRVWCEGNEVES